MAHRLVSVAGVVGLSVGLLSCGGDKGNTIQGSGSSTGGDSGIVDDTAGFYVKVVPQSGVTTYSHAMTGFSDECKIDTTASGKDVNCLVHVREHDLYARGLTFEINVPTTMCKYLWEIPYYYYNFEPGTGPRDISAIYDGDNGVMLSCLVDSVAGTVSGNTCYFPNGEGNIKGDGVVSCIYDHTAAEGPNCCEGEYAASITTRTEIASAPGTYNYSTSKSSGKYGGHHGQCIGGPATQNEWPRNKVGVPNILVSTVDGVGRNFRYKIDPPLNV